MANKKKPEDIYPYTSTDPEVIRKSLMPPAAVLPPALPPPEKSSEIIVLTDQETGKIAGWRTPEGNTFFGSPVDVKGAVEQFQAARTIPRGAVSAAEQLKLTQQRERGVLLAQQVGQGKPLPVTAPGVDMEQVVKAGLAGINPVTVAASAVGGGIAGLAGGPLAPVTAPIAAAASGGIAALATFYSAAKSNLKSQRGGQISAAAGGLPDHVKNLRAFVAQANKNPAGAVEYQSAFNEQLAYIERDFGTLHLMTQSDLNKFLGEDGTPVLADYERFYEAGGTKDYLILQMQTALINPDPNKMLLTAEELGIE